MTEDEAIAFIHQFVDYENPAIRNRGPGFTLDGMRCLLDLLDHPERAMPSIVVAGSKGKGSTSAMLASVLSAAGYRTGLYTQPHLHGWRERVRVDGRPLPPDALVAAVERLRGILPELPRRCPAIARPTAYELGTAVALLHFAAVPVQVAVLEIGLGGRLDAVNTVTPRASVITPISLEHTDVLGTTIAAIAGEKAGIIKPGVPVVVSPQLPAAAAVFERVAAERGAPLIWAADRAVVEPAGDPAGPLALAGRQAVTLRLPAGLGTAPQPPNPGGLMSGEVVGRSPQNWGDLRGPGGRTPAPSAHRLELPLLGAHQRRNAMTAVAAAEALAATGLPLSAAAIVDGLAATHWPGRLEVLRRSPLLIVDGAHNPDSASRLREALASHFPGRRLTLVLGILGDKDLDGIAAELTPGAARVIVTAPQQVRAAPIDRLVAAVEAAGGRPEVATTVAEALERAFATAAPDDMICLTGSLMTVAEARAWAGRSEI